MRKNRDMQNNGYPIYQGNMMTPMNMPNGMPNMMPMNMPSGMPYPMPNQNNDEIRNIINRINILEKRINVLESGAGKQPSASLNSYNDSNFYIV